MTKFFLYARKSTDEPDRQILSIEAQITELKEFAVKEQLNIVQTFIESQTAKEPGRPIFNDMVSQIEKGKAEGILAWHPDRLARNSVDGGRIIFLLDIGKIQALKFPTFWFESTPQGKFMLNIAFGQSKYYVDNLSENVKRGLRQKVRRGEYPGVAPTGYLNNRLTKKMVPDPERFRLVQKIFKLYSTGNYSLKEVRNIITETGLRSRNGKILCVSNIQYILINPFYYGAFKFNEEIYEGNHKPAITKKLFDKAQEVMKNKAHHTNRGVKFYAFRGLFKCGECNCSITAETHKGHDYYRCTKKKLPCSQKYVREESLNEQISKILQKISLPDPWTKKMVAELDKEKDKTERADFSFVQNLKSQINECKDKLDKLLDAQLEGLISTEEYAEKKQKILNQKIEISEKLKAFQQKGYSWLEPAKNFILASNEAKNTAFGTDLADKAQFLKKVGSNLVLADQNIKYFPRGAWKILGNLPPAAESRERDEAENEAENREYSTVLRD
ncbi:MAG: recombinase family protein [bacterium]|nr:recombinase family protein [bacterium]